ncbi:MAG: YbaB/EbfC family nucleoid-associated protein [Syntrophomonadaceae bacterium]|jgi:DNA-binding YbaB/EbfC family protein|nr:YbaB/EbfC family nucleoid-associated protein [Bacillota bacterium]NLM89535.1 YbaB/EbfC family nucleoid-associated protein [Syntrophomonadaceae bacterium]HAA09888.1 YbaB/EbfC family nucleoid-associated protein [Syntrophomonas sp.]HQA51173.1 YbaB/EbfC family nucleoid-associated protein [Syntrophomonadaceae bacterium]HQE23692.1 YbaB/EbfC family nucleoid-associated protein [Syntrophomonadaceae bacterium]
MKFGPGMGGNMSKMLKEAKKVQEQIVKMQAELEQREIEASAGGGAVTVVVNGKQELISVKISPEAVDPDDVEMLEDLVVAAVNEGIRKSQEMVSAEMARITGGLNIPGL